MGHSIESEIFKYLMTLLMFYLLVFRWTV